MKLIFRYLAKETYMTMLAATSILVLIFVSHQFVHYLGDAAIGRLTPRAVLQMMCIQVPLLLGFMLPLGFFLGILLSFGRLYVDHEMTILTSCGVSKLQILKMALFLALMVTIIVAVLMCWVEPHMARYRNEIIAQAASSSPIEKIAPGRFQLVGDWVLYSEGISRDRQKMNNVFAAALPAIDKQGVSKLPSLDVLTATTAFQKLSPLKEIFIVLSKGQRYRGIPGENKYQIVKFEEYGVRLPSKAPEVGKQEEFMSTRQLWDKKNDSSFAAAELQWRMAMPFSVMILTLFAVPLSEVKPRKGRFAQMLPAIIIYIAYTDLLFLGRSWIEKGSVSAYAGLWWIHAIMLLLALGVIYFTSDSRWMGKQ